MRTRAIRAAQARLVCEELLAKHVDGQFDLATNEALAAWERKNNIFGWGFSAVRRWRRCSDRRSTCIAIPSGAS